MEDVTKNNWLGIDMGKGGTGKIKKEAVVHTSFEFEAILKKGSVSYLRDTLDERIINGIKNMTGE